MKSLWVSAGVGAVLVALVSCGDSSDSSGPAQGTERGACYGNHTCNPGLSCISDLCVDASGSGGAPASAGASGAPTAGRGGVRAGGASGGEAGLSGVAGGDSTSDGGAAGASNAEPTKAELHITRSLEGADSHNPLTCSQAGGTTISITNTPSGNSTSIGEDQFDCSDGQGTVELDFGSYTLVTELLNQAMLSLGDSSQLEVDLAASPCDRIVTGRCVRDYAVKVLIDGK